METTNGTRVSTLFRELARARGARAFHPRGRWFAGELTTLSPGALPLPEGTRPVTVRMSKGAGVPGAGADVLGLAVRVPAGDGRGGPWDLALSASGIGWLTRMVPLPARGWGRARYGSIVPYRSGGRLVWLLAVCAGDDPIAPASLETLCRRVAERPPLLVLHEGTAWDGWRPVARLVLTARTRGPDPRPCFDPMRNRPAEVEMAPRGFAALRERAYHGSRLGRWSVDSPSE
ncbi:hypothetical protein GCM10027294_02500 [Marinactinospora endophytica]